MTKAIHQPVIIISSIKHRKLYVLLLKFDFNSDLIFLAKSIGCKWSSTNQGWYIIYTNENLRLINNAFKDNANIDFSKIKSILPKNNKKPVSVKIPEE